MPERHIRQIKDQRMCRYAFPRAVQRPSGPGGPGQSAWMVETASLPLRRSVSTSNETFWPSARLRKSCALKRRDVNENIVPAGVWLDKSVAFRCVEEFHDTGLHLVLPSRSYTSGAGTCAMRQGPIKSMMDGYLIVRHAQLRRRNGRTSGQTRCRKIAGPQKLE